MRSRKRSQGKEAWLCFMTPLYSQTPHLSELERQKMKAEIYLIITIAGILALGAIAILWK